LSEDTESRGYTRLSPDRVAIILARAGAVNVLPCLAGSGFVVAQSYEDETLAYTIYKPWQLIGLSVLIWILGSIGELFVPRLPLDIPRREFGIYSWLALFRSQVRGLSCAPCAPRANRASMSRSCNLSQLMTSLNS